jgi:chemotaxis protein methyltransferase CheR
MFVVTMEDYKDLTSMIYRKSGISFEDKKMYFINKRLEKRVDALTLP